MLWIGLTGSMGSGKSTVAKVLRDKGFAVLDADQVVHGLLSAGGDAEREILSTFGQSVAGAGGKLDRRALGRVVFKNKIALGQLEGILHPKVREEVARLKAELAAGGAAVAFYDVPLLFEKNMEKQFDKILVVSAPENVRRERLKARSNLSDAEITARFKSQISPEIKEQKASVVIQNDGDEKALSAAVDAALKKLKIK